MNITAMAHLLEPLFQRHTSIDLVYLFGSAAKGGKRPADIDIALLLKGPLRGVAKLNFMTRLTHEISTTFQDEKFFKKQRIEIVILNDASPFLCHQVIRHGKLLFEKNAKRDRDFRVKTMTRYFDSKPLHDFFYKHLMEK